MNKHIALSFFLGVVATVNARITTANADSENRNLQAAKDYFDETRDLCDNSVDGSSIELGECDLSRFPTCQNGKEFICYNRKPSREQFHPDNHQPLYYIQYNRVLCYPNNFQGCSSCTPGRYCSSENRCILEELNYPCEQWF